VTDPLVLKLGGELLESLADRQRIAALAASVAATRPLILVHGGGRAIDAELTERGIAPRKVDGLRVTDAATLDVVVSVLAGASNTELVAALVGQGVPAVGLTGVDAGLGRAVRVQNHQSTSGSVVDLGFVGDPVEADPALVELLLSRGYVPVIAGLGVDRDGALLNVNADVMACRIAASVTGSELVIAGATPGVLDAQGKSIPVLDLAGIDDLISNGTATAGMVAKLSSCRTALEQGLSIIRLVDGRALGAPHGVDDAPGTTLVAALGTAEGVHKTMTTTPTTDVPALESQHVLQTYRRFPVVFERGSGMRLFDDHGRAYLDFVSGIGVESLGHAHPALARALADQAATLVHTSNLYFHPLQGELAARLSAHTGLERAFFCNSGTEANEACLKFARRYWHSRGETARTKFVAFTHAFHGRTMGALSVTWDEHYRGPFAPLVPGVTFASTDAPDALNAFVDDSTAAIIVEPIQGEGGVRPISAALVRAIASACTRTGALLIADEVQSGSGRTGTFLHSPTIGLKPDLVALGKALGAGVPVGAAMVSARVAAAVAAGDHGTTYGGNLLACRAALVFLDALEGGLLENITRVSAFLFDRLRALQARHPDRIVEVRGAGFIAGLEFKDDVAPIVTAALERGLLVNRTATRVIRLLPPYIATERDVDEALGILEETLR
jgi:acetylornithine/N-succinyldiaminopimelate aminotransferase